MPSLEYEPDYRFSDKWHKDICSQGFTMVPNSLLKYYKELKLTPIEFLLLINIESYRWTANNLPFPTVETLAERTGITTRTVTRVITKLEKERHLLKRIKRKGTSNMYSFEPLIDRLLEIMKNDLSDKSTRQGGDTNRGRIVHNYPTILSSKEDSVNNTHLRTPAVFPNLNDLSWFEE